MVFDQTQLYLTIKTLSFCVLPNCSHANCVPGMHVRFSDWKVSAGYANGSLVSHRLSVRQVVDIICLNIQDEEHLNTSWFNSLHISIYMKYWTILILLKYLNVLTSSVLTLELTVFSLWFVQDASRGKSHKIIKISIIVDTFYPFP